MCPSSQWVPVSWTMCSALLTLIVMCGSLKPSDDVRGVTELPCPLPPPPARKLLKVHFERSRKVFRSPPPRLKARKPPPSRA